jgi:hypothetical protein
MARLGRSMHGLIWVTGFCHLPQTADVQAPVAPGAGRIDVGYIHQDVGIDLIVIQLARGNRTWMSRSFMSRDIRLANIGYSPRHRASWWQLAWGNRTWTSDRFSSQSAPERLSHKVHTLTLMLTQLQSWPWTWCMSTFISDLGRRASVLSKLIDYSYT